MLAVLSLDAVRRQQRPVTHLFYGDLPVLHRVDAVFHDHVLIAEAAVDPAVRLGEHLVRIVLAVLQKTGELVGAQAAADPVIPQTLGAELGHLPQQAVARVHAEGVVDQFEVLNVGTEDIIFHIRIPKQDIPDLLAEIFLAEHPGDPVILDLMDKGGGLPQADDAGCPV